jgi:phytoene dehydrogenase-like protein
VLGRHAQEAGVRFSFNSPVVAIRTHGGQVSGVETADGTVFPADRVVSNAHGIGTCLELLPALPRQARRRLTRLPLQSPGVCAYLAVRGRLQPPYLQFRLPRDGALCRLRVAPGVLAPHQEQDVWQPMRLIAPMGHAEAERLGESGQEDYLDRVLAESWWREDLSEYRVLQRRTPAGWARRHRLYRQSMNPVMTARFMRAGRLAHRSPYVRGLYLAGSSTHPGQWVSFCAISGILVADLLVKDRM